MGRFYVPRTTGLNKKVSKRCPDKHGTYEAGESPRRILEWVFKLGKQGKYTKKDVVISALIDLKNLLPTASHICGAVKGSEALEFMLGYEYHEKEVSKIFTEDF